MADKAAIIREAQKYLAKGQVDKAISEWEKLITEIPDGNAFNIIGDLYLKKGDKNKAVEFLHKAAVYFRQEGFSLKALALYKKVLNVDPNDPDSLLALGELSEEKGLPADAIKYYLAAADRLSKMGKKDGALDVYWKILSLSPSNIPLRIKVVEVLLKEGLHADAAKEYLHLARFYDDNGDIPKATEHYRKALELHPMNKEAAFGLGNLYEKSGRMEKAMECIKEAAALFPEDAEVAFKYAELCLRSKADETAKEYLLKVTGIEPKHLRAGRLLAEIYLKEGEEEKAWKAYLPVIDEVILRGNPSEAIGLLESFKKIDPVQTGRRLVSLYRQLADDDKVFSELLSLGDYLKETDMTEEAVSCYREALDLRPYDTSLREMLEEFSEKPQEPEKPVTEKEAVTLRLTEGEKTTEEILMEADVFSRYGLRSEAIGILEQLKVKEPQNMNLHLKLKALYSEASDKESLVTECLILHELYKRQGDTANSERMISDALAMSPEDPRLEGREASKLQIEPTSYATEVTGESGEAATKEYDIEDFEEEIAEADFYIRQGFNQDAARILERLHRLFPQDKVIAEKLTALGQVPEKEGAGIPASEAVAGQTLRSVETGGITDAFKPVAEEKEILQTSDETQHEDLSSSDRELADAQKEPEIDSDVLEIFQEFKKGLESELAEEDSETHYNLGIAYKEMGLLDDAIKEFQTSRSDPKRFMQSSTMLGVCYMEKGLYSLAIDVLTKAIKEISDKDESYWAIKYDLAEAYEKNNNVKEALDLYTAVFGWNAGFRNVSEKINQLKARIAKSSEAEKTKAKKDRVSYL
ncbi:MAG TPA: tetratricopeptide repeat protein [Candidatus Sulfobium mesophilum]|nr:tetratricopeptide repeat protein [Candidatus Sulfobium mesophilum]